MRKHAILSSSGSERWLICTPSARLEEQLPQSTSSYAEEGTLAHELAAIRLNNRFNSEMSIAYIADWLSTLKQTDQWKQFYSGAMDHHVQSYINIAKERYEKTNKKGDAMVMIEQRFDLRNWVPEGFGTSDFNIVGNGVLEIIDFKYGQGVPVSAEDNSQLKMYALGVYEMVKLLYEIKKVNLTVVQPRIDNTNSWTTTIDDLLLWAEEVLRPQAIKAWEGEGEFKPGEHCRFCRAKPTCKALAAHNQELAKYDFELPDLLTKEEIAEILSKAEIYINWLKSVQEYALQQAIKGVKFPGYKIVNGRSNRILTKTAKVQQLLVRIGFKDEDFLTPRKLKGLTELEALLGKSQFERLLSKYIIKPKGAPTLVRITDKRPGINSVEQAVDDFKHLKFNEHG